MPKTDARSHLPSIEDKKKVVRKFYDESRGKCVCGGFTLDDTPSLRPAAAAGAPLSGSDESKSPVAGEKDGPPGCPNLPKTPKKKQHTPAQLASIVNNRHNKEWLRHCVTCNRLYCRACRQHMSLDTCLLMVRYGYSWVTGIADGTKCVLVLWSSDVFLCACVLRFIVLHARLVSFLNK